MSSNPCSKTPVEYIELSDPIVCRDETALDARLEQAARMFVERTKAMDLSIASCESFTAGLFASTIASIPGASSVLCGGLVTYQTPFKTKLAHVPAKLIERYGVVSKECALSMASNTRMIFESSFAVSFTGNAGPDAMEGKPAGLVYMAICSLENEAAVYELRFDLPRNLLRKAAVCFALEELNARLESPGQ